MIRKITVLFLIAAIVSANFSRLFIYAGFELNKNYIAAKLCENRNKPLLHFNGKCYFMKKIKQADEKEKAGERQSQKNLFHEALFTRKPDVRFYSHVVLEIPVPNHNITLPVVYLPVFQPPQLG